MSAESLTHEERCALITEHLRAGEGARLSAERIPDVPVHPVARQGRGPDRRKRAPGSGGARKRGPGLGRTAGLPKVRPVALDALRAMAAAGDCSIATVIEDQALASLMASGKTLS